MSGASLADESIGYEVVEGEPPELLGRNLLSGSHLIASATAFFFLAFVFAYFYLRSLNSAGLWKPKGVDTSIGWGTVIVACVVASALLVRLGRADLESGRGDAWRQKGLAALVLGLLAVVLQAVAWTQAGFGPADGGFASVYVGWTAFLFLFELGAMYWLETTLATAWRYRNWARGQEVAPGEASGDAHRTSHDIRDPVSLVRSELAGLSFYWTFLAGIAVLSWVLLYLL